MRVLCLIFAEVFFQINVLWIFISSCIMWLGATVKSARYTTFDSTNASKIVIFPSIVRLRTLHNLRIFWMSKITLQKFSSFWIFLLREQWTPNILTVSDVKSTGFKMQIATWAPFSAPILAISHLEMLDFNPEKLEK